MKAPRILPLIVQSLQTPKLLATITGCMHVVATCARLPPANVEDSDTMAAAGLAPSH